MEDMLGIRWVLDSKERSQLVKSTCFTDGLESILQVDAIGAAPLIIYACLSQLRDALKKHQVYIVDMSKVYMV